MASAYPDNISNTETLASAALHIAQSQLGQSEKPVGSNSGPMVNEYLRSVGLNPGYAWCQAFVYWCYDAAAKKLGASNPVVRTAGVHDCWNHSKKGRAITKVPKAEVLLHPETVAPGDQIILSFGGNKGHTGIVEKAEGGRVHTIEGNSNNNGSREGYEVVRHVRSIKDKALLGFIKYQR